MRIGSEEGSRKGKVIILNKEDLSINGYYLSPSQLYKATALFGGDQYLTDAEFLKDDCKITFTDLLRQSLSQVNDLQFEADDWATKFAAGQTDNIHQVMIAAQKADIALQLATAVRSKIMDAYNEIMRMQI